MSNWYKIYLSYGIGLKHDFHTAAAQGKGQLHRLVLLQALYAAAATVSCGFVRLNRHQRWRFELQWWFVATIVLACRQDVDLWGATAVH